MIIETAQTPRSVGELRLTVKAGERTTLAGLRQAGCLKALFPRASDDGLTCVTLNTSGGITGGDRLRMIAEAGAKTNLTITTQAAERVYRAEVGEVGRVTTTLSLADGACLNWLPQETILFDHSALERRIEIDMAEDARLVFVEPLVLGRAAMGERLTTARLRDHIRLRRNGRLIFADALRLSGAVSDTMHGMATADGAGALAMVLVAAPDAERHLAPLRDLLPTKDARGGVSLIRPGLIALRLAAPDSFLLRRSLLPILTQATGAPLPRTWMI